MSTTPGINPLTPDLEEVRHSGDDAFEDPLAPAPSDDAEAEPSAPPADDDALPSDVEPPPA